MTTREFAAAGITDPRLRAGYEACRRLNAEHGKTYFLATMLLPAGKRPYVHALYGFARYADDIVDELDPRATASVRADRLHRWCEQVRADLELGSSSQPICAALIDTVSRWDIPIGYVSEFLDAMLMDLTVRDYESREDLFRYTRGSAAVIGLQMLPILGRAHEGVDPAALRARAAELGIAFQLTNFLRDIAEDLRRGRIYLPQEELRLFGVDREHLMACADSATVDDPVRSLIAYEIARTREIYEQAEPGIALVDPTSQPCLRTALNLYRGILKEIEDVDYNVFAGRVAVGPVQRIWVGGRGLASAWLARRPRATHTASVSNTSAKPNNTSSTGA